MKANKFSEYEEFSSFTFRVDTSIMDYSDFILEDFNKDLDNEEIAEPIRCVTLHTYSEQNEVAKIELYLIPDGLDNNGITFYLQEADNVSCDLHNELSIVVMHDFYRRDIYADYSDNCFLPSRDMIYSGSIHTLYISPNYRKMNIGSFLIRNLNKLLAYYLNMNVRCLATYINPFHDDVQENYAFSHNSSPSDRDFKMLKVITKFLRKNGFKKVRGRDKTFIVDLFELADKTTI